MLAVSDAGVDLGEGVRGAQGPLVLLVRYQRGPQLGGGASLGGVVSNGPGQGGVSQP